MNMLPDCPWCEEKLTAAVMLKERLKRELETNSPESKTQIDYLIKITQETQEEGVRHAALWLLQHLFNISPADAYAGTKKQAA